jgi:DHA3 family tetracycline resistance protein-like MFS transporter
MEEYAMMLGRTIRVTRIPLLRAFGGRSFTLLWSGQTASRIGDILYQVALAWWVLQATGSATAMGLVLVCAYSPMLLFLLIGGAAVDRLPRMKVMLVSDLARGALVSGLAVLAALGTLQIWEVYLAALLFGGMDAFFHPAYTALVPDLVPLADLPSANSLTSMGAQAGRILGPPIGAALMAVGGAPLAFGLNAASFFISAACLWPLLGLPTAGSADTAVRNSILTDVRAGIRFVRGTPWLWISIVMYALSNMALVGPYSVVMPALVRQHLHADVGTLGLLYGMFPIGYVLGGLWAARRGPLRQRGLQMYGGLLLAGLMLGAFGLAVPVLVLALAAIINGASLEVGSLVWTNLLQERVPRAMLGRVSSIDNLGSLALMPVWLSVAGWASDWLGPAPVFLLGGGLAALLGILGLIHPAIRNLE